MEEKVKVSRESLEHVVQQVFLKYGLNAEDAAIVSEGLIYADMRGISSHGILKVPIYTARLQDKLVSASTAIELLEDHPSSCLLEGNHQLGQVTGLFAMEKAIEKAKKYGIGCSGVRHSHHFGAAAYFVEKAMDENMIGLAITNTYPLMAAINGLEGIVGSNPLAIGIPADQEHGVVLDMATTNVAQGKINLALGEKRQIPLTWAIDVEGNPTDDPQKALQGFLLPIGGPKGFGLSLVIDLVSGLLTGSGYGRSVSSMRPELGKIQNSGAFFIAINIDFFRDITIFLSEMDEHIRKIKSAKRKDPEVEIFLPGEIEHRKFLKSKEEGVELPLFALEKLKEICLDKGIVFRL